MQERQSGGTECKKNFQCPDPAGEAYSAPPDLLAGAERDWLPPLQTTPALGPSGLASPVPPLQNCAAQSPLDAGWRRP